jgi:hypothetical protein
MQHELHQNDAIMMRKKRAKAITLRDLSPEVARAVRERARKDGLSLNRTVARLLEEATGHAGLPAPAGRTRRHDLDDFGGRWSKKEADAFDRFLAEHRTIDPEIWK